VRATRCARVRARASDRRGRSAARAPPAHTPRGLSCARRARSEALYEDETFAARQLAALVASKTYFQARAREGRVGARK
jgi:hypothetical protein